jgi:hypothetical protein
VNLEVSDQQRGERRREGLRSRALRALHLLRRHGSREGSPAEIEIDHGHEFELEFAYFDYLFNPASTLASAQAAALGKFNEVHDAPIQELTRTARWWTRW